MAEAGMRTESELDIDKLEADFQADAGNFVPLARAYLDRNLPRQALHVCKKGLSNNPNAPQGMLALGMAYYQTYDDQNAEMVMKKVLQASPDSAVAHRTLGEIFLDRGQEPKALSELTRSVELDSRDQHTRSLLVAMEEKPPPMAGNNGQPQETWLPRKTSVPGPIPKPMWHGIAQVMVVVVIMAGLVVWYKMNMEVRTEIREHLKEAAAVVARDNFDDLLAAEKSLKMAYALDDGDVKTITRLASVSANLWQNHNQVDRKAKITEYLAFMEKEDLPNPERFTIKALLLKEEGKAQEADTFLSGIIKRAIEKKDIFLNADIFGARALARLSLGQLKEAREDFSRAARFSGDTPHYQAAFASVYFREGNLPRTIKYYGDALRISPAHASSNLNAAYARILQGKDLEKAKKVLDEFLDEERHPANEFSPPEKGLLYLVRAEYALVTDAIPDANTWLRKSLETDDSSALAHNLAGRLASMNKDATKATAEFGRALQLDSKYPKIYFDRSESLHLLGDSTGAIEKLREFERALKPTVAYHVEAGNLYLRTDDMESAMNEFQKAVKVDELSPEARYQVARCYQAMGNKLGDDKKLAEQKRALYNDARQWYEDSVMLPGGERGEVYHAMGRIYLDSEDPTNALDKLAKAAVMMQKSREPSAKIAGVYLDVAEVFKYMGGPEGERQSNIYLAKAKGLREGKTLEEVEKEAAEQEKAAQKAKKKSKKKRRRR